MECTKADLAAAELMGRKGYISGVCCFIPTWERDINGVLRERGKLFSLFNKADRMNFTDFLLQKGIGICGGGSGRCFLWLEQEQRHMGDYADSTEACRAAAIYLKEEG